MISYATDRQAGRANMLWLPSADLREWEFFGGGDFSARTPSGIRVTPDNALQATVVLACIRCLAESIASLTVRVFDDSEGESKVPVKQHPLNRILSVSPNTWQTSFEWREQMVLHMGLYGNSYSQIISGQAGFASQLVPLHPSRMEVEEVEPGILRYIYTESNGQQLNLPAEEVLHFRWMSDDGISGLNPTKISRDAIALARACEIHGSTYFGNGARPGVILTTENSIDPEAAVQLRESWERIHRGTDKAWKTAVLSDGLKAVELGGNNQESQYLEVRRFQVEEICRVYRVPPHLVMDLTKSSFSNIEQQSLDFLQYTLTPWIKRIEGVLNRSLFDEGSRYFVEFDTSALIRGDAQTRASFYASMANLGALSINEIRASEGMNPVDGGDERFVPLNMQTLSDAEAPLGQDQVDTIALLAERVASGRLPKSAAVNLVRAAVPSLSEERAASFIGD